MTGLDRDPYLSSLHLQFANKVLENSCTPKLIQKGRFHGCMAGRTFLSSSKLLGRSRESRIHCFKSNAFNMKREYVYLGFLMILIASCGPGKKTLTGNSTSAQTDNCKDVPKLSWQIETRGLDDSTTSKLIADIQAAANSDATQSKIPINGSAKISSELAKVVSLSVRQSSNVTQDFWQQDLTFRQILCYYDSKTNDLSLSKDVRDKFIQAILDLTKTRTDYTFEVKKKTGSNQ